MDRIEMLLVAPDGLTFSDSVPGDAEELPFGNARRDLMIPSSTRHGQRSRSHG